MGCWNHTCAITNLPIFAGEEVEVILLKSNSKYHEHSSFCYTEAYYTPLPLTFSGKYNDYGAVEDCHGHALPLIVESLKKHLFEMEVGENEYHDIAAKKENFDIKELFNLDHEQRLFIENRRMAHDMRDSIRIKHIVIRKAVFDGIISAMQVERWTSKGRVKLGYEGLLKECVEYTKALDEIVELDKLDFKRLSWESSTRFEDIIVTRMFSDNYEGSYQMHYPISMPEIFFKMRENKDENYQNILENALKMSILRRFMDYSRKSWCVPSGVGSQEDNTTYQELCARLTLSEAEVVKHRWDDE